MFLYTPPSSDDSQQPAEDETEGGGLVGDVAKLQDDVTELKNRPISSADSGLKERVTKLDGVTEIEWEGKNLVANASGATMSASSVAVCTKEAITLKKGDKISLDSYDKCTLTVAGNIGTDNYVFKSNSSSDVYAEKDGEFYICVKTISGQSVTSDYQISLVSITRCNDANGVVQKLLGAYKEYVVPQFVNGTGTKISDFNVDSETRYQYIIDWYDDLKACHSSTMTRTQYGTTQTPDGFRATIDDKTYPMYAYNISPLEYAKHKIILAYGIHGNGAGGDAINGVVGLAYFIRHLLNGYMEHPTLEYIRKYCTVVVMPVLNPWGYQNNSRGNGRNIDLNRNFSAGFVPNTDTPSNELAYYPASDVGTPEKIVSGSEAFSESESVAIRDYIDTYHSDAVFMLEGHSRGERADTSIIANVKNRFLTFVNPSATGIIDGLKKAVPKLVRKYGGTLNPYTSSEPHGECFQYFTTVTGIPTYENECFGCYDNNVKTRGTDMTEIMCEDFIASTIIAVAESLLLN